MTYQKPAYIRWYYTGGQVKVTYFLHSTWETIQ